MFVMLLDTIFKTQAVKSFMKVKKLVKNHEGELSPINGLKEKAGIDENNFGLILSELPADSGKKDKKKKDKKKKGKTNDAALVSTRKVSNEAMPQELEAYGFNTRDADEASKPSTLSEKIAANKAAIVAETA